MAKLVDFVCRLLAALTCLGAGVIKISLIISCVKLCRLSLANGKAVICSKCFQLDGFWSLKLARKLSKSRMQANRQMIAAKAINLRANKAPFKTDEIIDFSLNSCSKRGVAVFAI
jgi:hypothetical protein